MELMLYVKPQAGFHFVSSAPAPAASTIPLRFIVLELSAVYKKFQNTLCKFICKQCVLKFFVHGCTVAKTFQ